MLIVGIDCATQENKTGLALGSIVNNRLIVSEVTCGSKNKTALSIITQWLSKSDIALIALDSPLGWPLKLSPELKNHKAGMPLKSEPDEIFTRYTDRKVLKELNKKPMDVGADKIAKTAHSALKLLHNIRSATGLTIPLACNCDIQETSAIEVYPAATLISHGISISSYKKKKEKEARYKIATQLQDYLQLKVPKVSIEDVIYSADTLDAVVCLLAAKDFLDGECLVPDNLELTEKEGWIWFRALKH